MAAQAHAAPREPLIVTQLSDPDPNFVASPSERKHGRRSADDVENSSIDAAMQEFGRAIGMAAMAQQQTIDARCKANDGTAASGAERFAWAAACQYRRH